MRRALRRNSISTAVSVVALTASMAQHATAQIPGAPTLQNAFVSPGLAVAANYGGGGGTSLFSAAAAWGTASGRLQASAAAGAQRGSGATRGAYGARVAANLWNSRGGAIAAGAFAGVGGAPRARARDVVTLPAQLIVPVGVSVGYRRAVGATRGIAAYVSPLYRWARSEAATVSTTGDFRVAFGADVTITQSFGATVGAEFGRSAGSSRGGGTLGVALTFVPGRQ